MLLVDCGEGTQRQLLRSTLGLSELDAILFTHFHADHVLGLPGLLKTYDLQGREHPLELIGPTGLGDLMQLFPPFLGRLGYAARRARGARRRRRSSATATAARARACATAARRSPGRSSRMAGPACSTPSLADDLGVPHGPERGALLRGESVTLADGRSVTPEQLVGPARRGRPIVLTGDTVPCDAVVDMAAGADLLVHEATFASDESERAKETQHSTARRRGARRARGERAHARAHARRPANRAARDRGAGARGLPRHGRAA